MFFGRHCSNCIVKSEVYVCLEKAWRCVSDQRTLTKSVLSTKMMMEMSRRIELTCYVHENHVNLVESLCRSAACIRNDINTCLGL